MSGAQKLSRDLELMSNSLWQGNIVLIVGALITANATGMGMLLAGRYITGIGCTTAATSGKSLQPSLTTSRRLTLCYSEILHG